MTRGHFLFPGVHFRVKALKASGGLAVTQTCKKWQRSRRNYTFTCRASFPGMLDAQVPLTGAKTNLGLGQETKSKTINLKLDSQFLMSHAIYASFTFENKSKRNIIVQTTVYVRPMCCVRHVYQLRCLEKFKKALLMGTFNLLPKCN